MSGSSWPLNRSRTDEIGVVGQQTLMGPRLCELEQACFEYASSLQNFITDCQDASKAAKNHQKSVEEDGKDFVSRTEALQQWLDSPVGEAK